MKKRNMRKVVTLSLSVCLIGIGSPTSLALTNDISKISSEQKIVNEETEKVQLNNGVILNSKEMGIGKATIVFDTGYGESLNNFKDLQQNLSKLTRTLSYDRAGLGGSSDVSNLNPLSEKDKSILLKGGTIPYREDDFNGTTKTAKDKAINLHKLLVAKNIPAPYILVSHSLGGHTAIEFAKMYKEEVRGIVFLDSSSRNGTGDLYKFFKQYIPELAGDDYFNQYTHADGTLDDVLMSENQVKNDKDALKNIPLMYVECDPYAMAQGDIGKAFGDFKNQGIKDLLSLSNDSRHIQIKGAGHYVHIDKPEETLKAISDFYNHCTSKN